MYLLAPSPLECSRSSLESSGTQESFKYDRSHSFFLFGHQDGNKMSAKFEMCKHIQSYPSTRPLTHWLIPSHSLAPAAPWNSDAAHAGCLRARNIRFRRREISPTEQTFLRLVNPAPTHTRACDWVVIITTARQCEPRENIKVQCPDLQGAPS